jgi:hypothetical protein
MAESVTLDGQTYTKRNPLGVLGLSIITLGIYWLYWYYQVNVEIRRFQEDDTVRPGIALLAMVLGWILIVPPFISMYNTSVHVAQMEERGGIPSRLSPALNIVLLLVFAFGTGIYTQEHLNRVWETATTTDTPAAPIMPGPPPA